MSGYSLGDLSWSNFLFCVAEQPAPQGTPLFTGHGIKHHADTLRDLMNHNRRQAHRRITRLTENFDFQVFVLAPLPITRIDQHAAKTYIDTGATLYWQAMFV